MRQIGQPGAHTPGPWHVSLTGDTETYDGAYARASVIAEGGVICTVHECANPRRAFNDSSLPDSTERPHGPIQKANARLLASAPALLEELRKLVGLGKQRGSLHEFAAAIRSAEAVINEASPESRKGGEAIAEGGETHRPHTASASLVSTGGAPRTIGRAQQFSIEEPTREEGQP